MKRMSFSFAQAAKVISSNLAPDSRFLLLALLLFFALVPATSLHAASCWPAWNSSTAYVGGSQVSYNGQNYQSAYWTQGNNPSTSSGPAGSGQPWIPEGSCSGGGATPTTSSTPKATPTPTSTGGCSPGITAYLMTNGGSWQKTASVTVS